MERWARMEFQALVLAVAARSVAHAGDDDWERTFKFDHHFETRNEWKPKPWPPATPRWFIAAVVCMVVFFVVTVIAFILCHLKRRRMLERTLAQQMVVPPPLTPATSGAQTYSYPNQQPLVSGAVTSPVAPYPPQQRGYPPQSMPYTQVPLYAAHNGDSSQPPFAPLPMAPPLDAPPPYTYDPVHKQ